MIVVVLLNFLCNKDFALFIVRPNKTSLMFIIQEITECQVSVDPEFYLSIDNALFVISRESFRISSLREHIMLSIPGNGLRHLNRKLTAIDWKARQLSSNCYINYYL